MIEADPASGSLNQGLFLAREPSTIVLADAIKSVEFDRGARDGDPRVDLVLAKVDAVRDSFLKTMTLEDIRSPDAKAVEQETTGRQGNADHRIRAGRGDSQNSGCKKLNPAAAS